MARPRKVPISAELTASTFADAVEAFKAEFPEDWEALRLCPLQHGLDTMIEKLGK